MNGSLRKDFLKQSGSSMRLYTLYMQAEKCLISQKNYLHCWLAGLENGYYPFQIQDLKTLYPQYLQQTIGFHMSMQEPNLINVPHNDYLQVTTWLVIWKGLVWVMKMCLKAASFNWGSWEKQWRVAVAYLWNNWGKVIAFWFGWNGWM